MNETTEIADLIETEHNWVLDLEQHANRDTRELAVAWRESNPMMPASEVNAWLHARVHDPDTVWRLRRTPHERVHWHVEPRADMLWETRERVKYYEPDELAVIDSVIGDFADTIGFKLASGLVEFRDLNALLWPVCLAEVDPDQVDDIRKALTWHREHEPDNQHRIKDLTVLLDSLTTGRVDLTDEHASHVHTITDEGVEVAMTMFPDHDFCEHSFRLSDPGCRGFRYWQGNRRHV